MMSKRKVVKFRKRRSLNIGIIIFTILFIYIAIQVLIFINKDELAIYEVKVGSNIENEIITGIIFRKEEVIQADESGYIYYLLKDGDRVYKKAPVYSIDDNKAVYEMILDSEEPIKMSAEYINEMKNDIKGFNKRYSDDQFHMIYDFKEKLENTATTIFNNAMISNVEDIANRTGVTSNYKNVLSSRTGVVSYHIDSFEHLNMEDLNMDIFELENYSLENLKTDEIVGKDAPIYKLVTSENWSIVFPLNEEQLEELKDKDSIELTLIDKNVSHRGPLSLIKKGNENYAKVDLDKYMSLYINDRFVEAKLTLNNDEGFKIPVSTIVNRDFNLIPMEYLTVGGDSNAQGAIKVTYNESGEKQYQFTPTKIYYEDGEYAYVSKDEFPIGTLIFMEDKQDEFQIGQTQSLEGVFNVNQGYAVFRRIESLYQNNEYCIIKKDSSYGVSLYDHLALNGDKVVEEAIIY